MLKLGPISDEEHQKIADYLSDKNIEVNFVGKEFGATKTTFKKYPHVNDLLAEKSLSKINDHLVLIKGSRGIKLDNGVERKFRRWFTN